MTWKQIKEKIEKLGIKDDDEIEFMDIGAQGPSIAEKDSFDLYRIY